MRIALTVLLIALAGCAPLQNPLTMNVMPTLTADELSAKVAECRRKNLIPEPYPAARPQIVICHTRSVLPPGYVSPVPYVRTL